MEPAPISSSERADIITIVEFALRHKARVALPDQGPEGEGFNRLAYRAAAEKIVEHMHRTGVTFGRNHPPPLLTAATA